MVQTGNNAMTPMLKSQHTMSVLAEAAVAMTSFTAHPRALKDGRNDVPALAGGYAG
jgi:hypothetical protein